MSSDRDRLLNFLLGWAMFVAALPTLILYRAVVQPRYQWGLFGIVGEGITSGLLVIVAAALLAWSAVVLGSWRTRAAGAVFVALNGVWFVSILIGVFRQGSARMTLRGDALGVRVNIALVGPLVFGALLLLSIWWWTRRTRAFVTAVLPLSRGRRILLGAAAGMLPVILVLFALGNGLPHKPTDRLAVVCVIIQVLFVGAGLHDLPVLSIASDE